ncbi:sterol desaturase family protein [Rosistilla oblonga]|uniref:sterol desaturase family protein n=1 Tax=Rosistilla oblonga TaxID=2527990 RepID=UPI003A97ADAB
MLFTMAAWEWLAPRRKLTLKRQWRWSGNIGLVVLNGLLVRLLVPMTTVGAAVYAQTQGWGLLNIVDWPMWLEVAIGILVFDLAIYGQHMLFHAVPLLWRLHMVHHADMDFDVTTGLRFHTFEILLSALIKLAVVIVLGPAAIAVVAFEVMLNATSMFNHSNVSIPLRLDRVLRFLVVTPDMHRVHHSIIRREANSNFGFNLPWWDYLFRTYVPQPKDGHEHLSIGVKELRDEHQTERLTGMLQLPFRSNSKRKP